MATTVDNRADDNPMVAKCFEHDLLIRDVCRGLHRGQRSHVPHQKAGHMTAPDHRCYRSQTLLHPRGRPHMLPGHVCPAGGIRENSLNGGRRPVASTEEQDTADKGAQHNDEDSNRHGEEEMRRAHVRQERDADEIDEKLAAGAGSGLLAPACRLLRVVSRSPVSSASCLPCVCSASCAWCSHWSRSVPGGPASPPGGSPPRCGRGTNEMAFLAAGGKPLIAPAPVSSRSRASGRVLGRAGGCPRAAADPRRVPPPAIAVIGNQDAALPPGYGKDLLVGQSRGMVTGNPPGRRHHAS